VRLLILLFYGIDLTPKHHQHNSERRSVCPNVGRHFSRQEKAKLPATKKSLTLNREHLASSMLDVYSPNALLPQLPFFDKIHNLTHRKRHDNEALQKHHSVYKENKDLHHAIDIDLSPKRRCG
jgi:hypothetical protein